MARFEDAIGVILKHEGGYQDGKNDAGGATNYGISLAAARGWGLDVDGDGDTDAADIRALTRDQAIEEYRRRYWRYDAIVDQVVATKVFDMAVNMGEHQANVLVQRALVASGRPVAVDGLLGPRTLAAINSTGSETLLTKLVATQADFYRDLAADPRHPERKGWLSIWLHRAAWPLGSVA